ncbi:glucosaminidase domain-containing protein [Dactylosporangium sp. NPDC048998]|uniref:glucosaminidase domain-containing protein n=1 Tax=Dactylosporangium sp. NPDC048998 TaxID=3363976 RepID=UPI0037113D70
MGDPFMLRTLKKYVFLPALALAATATTLVVAAAPADAAVVSVRVKGSLAARTGAANWFGQTRSVKDKQKVTVTCRVSGQYLCGNVRRTAQWDRTALGDYISHAYVSGNPKLPVCAPPAAPTAPAAPRPAAAPVAAVPAGPTGTMTNEQFLAASIPAAQQSQRDTRVPTSVTLAQAILESGWGRSSLSANDRNFFGMKCFNNVPGPYASGCLLDDGCDVSHLQRVGRFVPRPRREPEVAAPLRRRLQLHGQPEPVHRRDPQGRLPMRPNGAVPYLRRHRTIGPTASP